MTKCCPACGQIIPQNIRYGKKLSKIQLKIFDKIAVRPGITQRELNDSIWERPVHKTTISVHVGNINDLFADTDLRIIGRSHNGYRLQVPKGMKR